MIEPKIESLLERVENPYTLVIVAAKRARQVVDYYTKLGAGSPEKPVQPLIEAYGLKPLTIALREIQEEKIGYERPPEAEESVK